ncbi:MAG: hypothetical protein WD708_00545 [Kiritimatiellia bacterium]
MPAIRVDGLRLDAVKHIPAFFFGQQSGAGKDSSGAGYLGAMQDQFNLTYRNIPSGNVPATLKVRLVELSSSEWLDEGASGRPKPMDVDKRFYQITIELD